jgi:hypothetical protein
MKGIHFFERSGLRNQEKHGVLNYICSQKIYSEMDYVPQGLTYTRDIEENHFKKVLSDQKSP